MGVGMAHQFFLSNWDGAPPGVGALRKRRTLRIGSGGTAHKALMFAYKTTSGSARLYLNSILQTYVPSRSLRSASEHYCSSQRGTKSLSLTFSLTVPTWWNDLPNSIRAAESLAIFKKRLKTHLFHLYLTL